MYSETNKITVNIWQLIYECKCFIRIAPKVDLLLKNYCIPSIGKIWESPQDEAFSNKLFRMRPRQVPKRPQDPKRGYMAITVL